MWGPIAAAAISAGGNYLASKNSGQEAVMPWEQIHPAVRPGYLNVQQQIYSTPNPRYFPGATVAGINPTLDYGLNQSAQYGNPNQFGGQQMGNAATAGNIGTNALASANQFTNWQRRAGPNQFGFDQGLFNQTLNNLMPGVGLASEAATRDIFRDFNWNQITGMKAANTALGGMGHTKLGQNAALAEGLAQKNVFDTNANLYMNALNQANQAGYGAGMANLGSANQWRGDIMRGYQGTAGTGLPLLNQAFNMGQIGINNRLRAGEFRQGQQQRNIDAEMARWNFNQNAPWNSIQQRLNMQALATGNPTIPGTPGANPYAAALQGIPMGLGLYGMGQNAGWWGNPAQVDPYVSPEIAGVDWNKFK